MSRLLLTSPLQLYTLDVHRGPCMSIYLICILGFAAGTRCLFDGGGSRRCSCVVALQVLCVRHCVTPFVSLPFTRLHTRLCFTCPYVSVPWLATVPTADGRGHRGWRNSYNRHDRHDFHSVLQAAAMHAVDMGLLEKQRVLKRTDWRGDCVLQRLPAPSSL